MSRSRSRPGSRSARSGCPRPCRGTRLPPGTARRSGCRSRSQLEQSLHRRPRPRRLRTDAVPGRGCCRAATPGHLVPHRGCNGDRRCAWALAGAPCMTPALAATLFGSRTVVFIYVLHARLVPDTAEYASGSAAWSSPLASLAGRIAGSAGVDVFAIVSSAVLGYLVCRWSGRGAGRRTFALYALPPSWATAFPGADAAGAAAAPVAARRPALLLLVAACHLEAAFVVALFRLARRLGGRGRGTDVAVCGASGLMACFGPTLLTGRLGFHLQTRYWLPGLAIVLTGAGR